MNAYFPVGTWYDYATIDKGTVLSASTSGHRVSVDMPIDKITVALREGKTAT